VSTARLAIVAFLCMFAGAALSLMVAHGTAPYGFEKPAIAWLGRPSALQQWGSWSNHLGNPVVVVVVFGCLVFGASRGAVVRVVLYGLLALAAFLINEHIAKPLVDRTYDGALTFPSGHVTAACATAFAMWLALFPLLKNHARVTTAILGLAWVGLMSLAVVGARWHTPIDAVGSVILAVGIVAAGGAVLELPAVRRVTIMNGERPKADNKPAPPHTGVRELLGEVENPVGVTQSQRVNQEER
jgi:membrane-associated phospholipid phosphatase